MSTFNGIVSEFPRIRIDYFRIHPLQPPPLACFLSHIHSDHLQGLESLKAPFVYCSVGTRNLLLQLEKYAHRMNFMRGVLESRKQHYKHLKLVLKAIPLECPTEIELSPLEKIRVTLFDANHCPGAVMFLLECDSTAILYTGDIRSESWWINSIIRHPVLLPYSTGLKQLDRIYLDTTFALKANIYRSFPSKAEGICELLTKVRQYPPETLFHLNAWTLGYEDVWVALSTFLKSSVHIDSYQSRLYGSLSSADFATSIGEYSALTGFYVGNHCKPGCLTTESTTRIHSCELGTPCHTELLKAKHVLWIIPIITRSKDGIEVPELGAGGGGGDLQQTPVLELSNISSISEIEEYCKRIVKDPDDMNRLLSHIELARSSRNAKMSLQRLNLDIEDEITLQEFVERLLVVDKVQLTSHMEGNPERQFSNGSLSKDTIHFPYSRHSSYSELCELVGAFNPADIYPCTVDEQTWTEDVSMKTLFGHLCSGTDFVHDGEMRMLLHKRLETQGASRERLKRKFAEDSETRSSSNVTSQEYNTAATSATQAQAPTATVRLPSTEDTSIDNKEMPPYLAAIKAVYDARMAEATAEPLLSSLCAEELAEGDLRSLPDMKELSDSQLSISQSAFDTQAQDSDLNAGLQLDGTEDKQPSTIVKELMPIASRNPSDQRSRRKMREQAYQAAKLTLQSSDSGAWDDLGIRSVGSNGHCESEDEL
ncbi:hypothetical protein EPUS_02923 [Endocarpon pusillum Z07020]|uniref:Protein artemis n=1 Tax=Endocarpon pusillum (strain Z07020 / HMAS-L-300199) TaxID=1263415 RepID=U1G4C2_ENDPU|nr:uncharacterized protein EPUS_02923 [Endocarpon pusillum Z07020]ERF72132.1 hypothetical protein EPUS_02923 [Endocarpon pusillum Z07020]